MKPYLIIHLMEHDVNFKLQCCQMPSQQNIKSVSSGKVKCRTSVYVAVSFNPKMWQLTSTPSKIQTMIEPMPRIPTAACATTSSNNVNRPIALGKTNCSASTKPQLYDNYFTYNGLCSHKLDSIARSTPVPSGF